MMPGLLDFLNSDDARLGVGLLAAAGPQTDPTKTGFGQRLEAGMASADAAKKAQLANQYTQAQIGDVASQAQLRAAQVKQMNQQMQFMDLFQKAVANGMHPTDAASSAANATGVTPQQAMQVVQSAGGGPGGDTAAVGTTGAAPPIAPTPVAPGTAPSPQGGGLLADGSQPPQGGRGLLASMSPDVAFLGAAGGVKGLPEFWKAAQPEVFTGPGGIPMIKVLDQSAPGGVRITVAPGGMNLVGQTSEIPERIKTGYQQEEYFDPTTKSMVRGQRQLPAPMYLNSDQTSGGATAAPTAGAAPLPDQKDAALVNIAMRESGMKNVPNSTGDSSAEGYYQITKDTWKDGTKLAGVDIDKYPRPMAAPFAVQRQVAEALYDSRGEQPWAASAAQASKYPGAWAVGGKGGGAPTTTPPLAQPIPPTAASGGASMQPPPGTRFAQIPPSVAAQQKANEEFLGGDAKNMATYREQLNNRVREGGALNLQLQEAVNDMQLFQSGGGKELRAAAAQKLQAIPWVPQSMIDKVAGGDLGAMQEFQKLAASRAMDTLKASMAGQGRVTQNEFKIFQAVNPNLDTDPRATQKIFDFTTRQYNHDLAEQQGLEGYLKDGGNPTSWPAAWSQQQAKTGWTRPDMNAAKEGNVAKSTAAATPTAAPAAAAPQALQKMISDFTAQNPPQKYKGKTATDPESGIKLISDGMTWKKAG